ncbi:MAG: 2Fe-2S iron-sulfur cluster-binding protein [Steroidobacteraceae bacterium]
MMYRLPAVPGEWLDRTQPLAFSFEGKRYQGFAGDTISSALAAAGVMMLGRSFKYHRPRGIHSFANHDVNALVQIGAVPNVRADVTALSAGIEALAVNTVGGLTHDRGRVLDRFARFLPVGFYYKAFHSKRNAARWEQMFRRLSGLGHIPLDVPRMRTPKRYAFCDVLVIGGGPSGLSAALAAADAGARVLLVEESPRLGGSGVWNCMGRPERQDITHVLMQRAQAHPRIEVLTDAYAAGYYADHWIAVVEPTRMTKVRTRATVLATGAIDLPAIFRNNDLPGILQASAAQRLLYRHGVAVGHDVAIYTCNDDGYAAALDLLAHNVRVTRLIDTRSSKREPQFLERLIRRGVKVERGLTIIEARAGRNHAVQRVLVKPSFSSHVGAPTATWMECDALLMSHGSTPALQLYLQAGGYVHFDDRAQQHIPEDPSEGLFVAGRANGIFGLDARLLDGEHAGKLAAVHAGLSADIDAGPAREQRSALPTIVAHPDGKDFVDFDEDLQVKDLHNAASEGFDSIELLKRYSTVGMGPSQGKHSNFNAARVLGAWRGEPLQRVGLTTARPMVHPVPLKHLAGRGFQAHRTTPLQAQHVTLGAKWMLAGQWQRPEYYTRPSVAREQAIAAEVAAVRHSVGIIDVSTLGKIEIHGRDAGVFLDRAYAGMYSTMKVGTTRYALLLDEAGTIVDDGVVARLSEARFYFTTTTGNSATVYRELLRLAAIWRLDCALVNVTGHRAAMNVAGPASRDVLKALTDSDVSEQSFPFLAAREAQIAGVRAVVLRVGFVSELGYELHVSHSQAAHVWKALMQAGREYTISGFGVEAQRVLRLEKGHFIIGQDTDGLTNPFEARAAWAVKMNKPFFVGQRSLRILQQREPKQLLSGLVFEDDSAAVRDSHLIIDDGAIAGRVTSVARSQAVGKLIALAMLKPAVAQVGTKVRVRLSDGRMTVAEVVPTPFHDADSRRQVRSEAA